MRDADGFLILTRKDPKEQEKPAEKPKKNRVTFGVKIDKEKQTIKCKKPKVHFKKGGWKWTLWKKIRDWRPNKYVFNFNHKDMATYAIYHPDGLGRQLVDGRGGLKTHEINMLRTVDPDSKVLVSCGSQMFMQISLKAYKKLMKIDKVAIHFKLTAYNDYEPEQPMDVAEYDDVYDNINALLGFINYHRQGIIGVYDVQAMCLGFTDFVYDFKILVYEKDGKIKTYKGDMNDFMIDYDLMTF